MSVDDQLRSSYDKWREAFYGGAIETTPAYDVVGLLAVLTANHTTYFKEEGDHKVGDDVLYKNRMWEVMNVEEKDDDIVYNLENREPDSFIVNSCEITQTELNPQPLGATVLKLKEQYRTKESLETIFSNMTHLYQKEQTKLLIVTDFGEETDDEVTCLLADRLSRDPESKCEVKFLFTTKQDRYENQKAKFGRWGGDDKNVSSIYKSEEEEKVMEWFNNDRCERIILQIGPVHEPEPDTWKWRPKIKKGYRYAVVGVFEPVAALNVSGDAGDCALYLMGKATQKLVVDTIAGAGAFRFSAPALNVLFPMRHLWLIDYGSIQEHVCKIGWRNSVGRADPFAGKFVAHLVSKSSADGTTFLGGANYMTALKIHEDLGGGPLDDNSKAHAIAEKYLVQLQHRAGPPSLDKLKLTVEKETGITNSKPGVTSATIVDGYEFILKVLNKHFDVPCEFFVSGKPEDWKPQWDTPSMHDKAMHDKVVEFKLLPNMTVSEGGEETSDEASPSPDGNAFMSGIPAGAALIGIGEFTKGLAIQVRSQHPANTVLLKGHYKLLNSKEQLSKLLEEHMPVNRSILLSMIKKLSASKSRNIEKVAEALIKEVDPMNRKILEKTMLSTKEWRLISTI